MGLFYPSSKSKDDTYGRYLAPLHPAEEKLAKDSTIAITGRRFYVDERGNGTGQAEDVQLAKEELSNKLGSNWIFYRTWYRKPSDSSANSRTGEGIDVMLCHGLYEHGGRWAPHVDLLLNDGFRIIVPDLPTHGRSSGLHVLIKDESHLPKAIEAVMKDLVVVSKEKGEPRRRIVICGHSLGGWTVITNAILFPRSAAVPTDPSAPHLIGIYTLAPYLGANPEAVPNIVVQLVGRGLCKVLPSFQMIKLVIGLETDQPEVTQEFKADPLAYHSAIRIASGVSLLSMASFVLPDDNAAKIMPPVRIVHGKDDRVCAYEGSVEFMKKMKEAGKKKGEAGWSEDKEVDVWEGFQHVMHPYGFGGLDEKQEAMRQRLLHDMRDWIVKQAQVTSNV
ncbi:Lysophospholipase [Phaffia rhodozyma]|uniref:Lysophospholipase n=1 Tax=Phaffia rhodozyma TaxID=264483 RepID=A0A0F7SNJ5_PHARH|nr:Lysophospholipase [Phaffia rhodozyma]